MQTRVAVLETAGAENPAFRPMEHREVSEAPRATGPAVMVVGATRNELRVLAGPASRLASARGARLTMLFLPMSSAARRRRGAATWLRSLAGEYNAEGRVSCAQRGRPVALRKAVEQVDASLVIAAGGSPVLRQLGDCTGVETLVVHRASELSDSRRVLAVVESGSRARLTAAAAEGAANPNDETGGEVVLLAGRSARHEPGGMRLDRGTYGSFAASGGARRSAYGPRDTCTINRGGNAGGTTS